MADTYWLSFELKSNATYSHRYAALIDAVKKHVDGSWWFETTSFYVFRSNSSADEISRSIISAIDPSVDRAVLGMTDYKTTRGVGQITEQNKLQGLIPSIKYL